MAEFLSIFRRLYLTVYNWTLFLGWFQVLCLVLKTLKESVQVNVYDAVEKHLQLAQTAAVLEFLHGLVGLVRSPVTATLPQISSRLFVTWGILWSFPETRSHVLVSSLLISWSITEIIRYSFFGMKEALGFAPSWLLWLRYSTFIVLYPTGITSEVGLIFTALQYTKGSEKYCIRMPNKWNFSFDYFYASILVLGIYIPGSLHLYGYMPCTEEKKPSQNLKGNRTKLSLGSFLLEMDNINFFDYTYALVDSVSSGKERFWKLEFRHLNEFILCQMLHFQWDG
ncbi:Very-long-chain (3R)-3-hydroxyacyl-CoA dehydratase [Quillaja saponaria]|uniref:Very-long-chain (3R)-3-hydroxyacyl-CoA dehydratase n=1 Tax=Quillaja saponaria TaxID=32244 RepID=A0AAD7KR49_QUISA|nr:Very-long-chain (3R)-3-hydroxyacyl-CoA dehydratase [Quillaja saponaria]